MLQVLYTSASRHWALFTSSDSESLTLACVSGATRTQCLCRGGNTHTHTHTQRERERNQHRNIAYSARFLNSNRRPNRLKTPEQFKLIIPHRRTIRSILIVGMLHLLIRFRLSHSSFPAPHTASPLLHRHTNPRTGISFVETRAVYIQARKWINHSIARCSTGQTQGSGWRSRHNVMQISYQKVWRNTKRALIKIIK